MRELTSEFLIHDPDRSDILSELKSLAEALKEAEPFDEAWIRIRIKTIMEMIEYSQVH